MSSFETVSWDETRRVIEENAPLDQAWTLFPPFLMRLTELDSSASSVRSISMRMRVAARMYFDYVLTHHESHMKADLLSGVLLARREKRIHAFFRLHEGGVLLLTYEPKSLQAGYRVLPFSCGRPGFLKENQARRRPFPAPALLPGRHRSVYAFRPVAGTSRRIDPRLGLVTAAHFSLG